MEPLIGAGAAFAIALVTTPVGVSGAVFLIPVQVSVLETPNPGVTPTNLFYNLIATPGALARYGRDPDGVSICPATYIIVGETKTIAEDKRAMIDKLARPIDALALLSEALNFDFASKPMDQAFTNEELKNISGLRGILDRVVLLSGKTNPTLGDFVHYSKRGTIGEHPVFCGTPKEVADQMEEWFTNCCDGFVFAATSLPGTYEDIVRLVVPELQRRGLHQKEYKGKTLRENLRLPKAQIGDWKRA